MHSRIVPWCQTFCFVQNMAGSSRRLRTQAWCLALLAIAPMLCRGFLHAAPHRGLSTRLDRRASCFFRLYAGIDPKKRRRNRPSDDDDDNEDMRGGGGEDEDDLEYERVRPEIRRVRPPLRREARRNRLPFGIPWIPQGLSAALLAGVFVLGVGTGVTVDSAINTNPKDLASRDAIDKNAPNPKICQRYGSSAMVLDNRVFVSFNPFNIFVTQADVKPGCVLRAANIGQVLEARGLLTVDEVNTCKNGSNTWAYVGDLNDQPQLSCVYQSDDAQNEFLSNPKVGLGEDVYDNPGKVIMTKKPPSPTPKK